MFSDAEIGTFRAVCERPESFVSHNNLYSGAVNFISVSFKGHPGKHILDGEFREFLRKKYAHFQPRADAPWHEIPLAGFAGFASEKGKLLILLRDFDEFINPLSRMVVEMKE